jgi:superfamily II DNA or RNA helicase
MVMPQRPYQRLALYHLRRCLYVDLPTGTGKSAIAAEFASQRLVQTQGRVLVLLHRQDLAMQLAETLRQEELEVALFEEGRFQQGKEDKVMRHSSFASKQQPCSSL